MKKNLRKIPTDIIEKLRTIKSKEIVVGCAVKFKSTMLSSGKLKHLGITLTNKGLLLPISIIPSASQGKYSSQNVNGVEIVRKDLPKEQHYNIVESPNWGDDYKGTHTVELPYEKYPREFKFPLELEIVMKCNNTKSNQAEYIIAFKVNEVLERKRRNFKDKLLGNLNLLQENIGSCGVEAAEVELNKYEKSLNVSWEILPPGTREETIERVFKGKSPTVDEKNVAGDRYDFFMSLKPKRLVFGSSGFRRYFGALIEDDLVVFENIQYGNAVYILFDNWKESSKRSRLDLLSGKYGRNFERVIHNSGWKKEIRTIVKGKQAEKIGIKNKPYNGHK
jgi:hypothetical protein